MTKGENAVYAENSREKQSTIFLAFVVLMLAILLGMNALASFFEKNAFFLAAGALTAIRIPSLLFFGVFIVSYTAGLWEGHKKRILTSALISALLFLLVEMFLNFSGSIFTSFTSSVALIEGVLTFIKSVVWIVLFFWTMGRVSRNSEGAGTKGPQAAHIVILIVVCIFVVSLPVIEYSVIYPSLGGVTDLASLSLDQMLEQMAIGDSLTIKMFRGVELASWWILASVCAWISWITLSRGAFSD